MSRRDKYHVVSCLLVLGAGLLAGCGPVPRQHMYAGPERPIDQLATIEFSSTQIKEGFFPMNLPSGPNAMMVPTFPSGMRIVVTSVDGMQVRNAGMKIYITPGKRHLGVRFDGPMGGQRGNFSFMAMAGETYYLDSAENRGIRWFELTVFRDGKEEKVRLQKTPK